MKQPIYKLRDLVDIPALTQMLNTLYDIASIPSAIIDMDGNILTGAGWQRICTDFFRQHPEAEKKCIQSDIHISSEILSGKPYVIYKCPHGLVDSSCPIIIEGQHLGNVFTGQMLHEPLDNETIESFRNQARQYGFNEKDFLKTLSEVPVYPLEKHKLILDFLVQFAGQIAKMGITNLKSIEQSKIIQESEKRFRLLMDSLDALVYVADMDTYEVLFINQYGREMLGDITGKTCWQSIQKGQSGPCDFCTNKHLVDVYGKPGDVYIWEFQNTATGKWFDIHDRLIEWIDGRIVRLEIANDITDRKKTEIEKLELQTHLNQAQKLEAIGVLAGGIAHDFNNILGVILGYTDMAMEDAGPGSKVAQDLSKVLASAHRAKDLVKQILAFSRQSFVDRMPMQIQPLIKESLKMLRSSIPTTISITQDIHPQCGVILADPTQIHQVVMNLCTNAYQAMEEIGGELSVTLKTAEIDSDDRQKHLHLAPGEYVELAVTDTGSGIETAILDKIFDPYFTTKEIGKGTGMGLAIIHGLMKDYGGAVTVESQLGKGSTFHVYFPVVDKDALPEIKESEDVPGGKERILFIDDEKLLAEMGKDMLERLGYHVTVRCSSLEALQAFQNAQNAFDLVITDQTMPDMTGSDLARRMLQIRPDIPIILCTGYSNIIDEHSAEALGIKAFALKPFTKGVIAELIRKVLDVTEIPPKKGLREPASILIVDDEKDIRSLLKDMLEREGYIVSEATDGEEALTLNRKEQFDLILMDLFMGGKQGLETIVELRREDPEIKIIAVSGGHADGDDNKEIFLRAAKELGAVQVFGKPINKEKLLQAIRKVLK